MEICSGCKKPVRFYHKKGFNSFWHKSCSASWNEGYKTATDFCNSENKMRGYPTANELYVERSSNKR